MSHRILVVDDESHIVKVLEMRLKAAGYEVLTARDGQEGLELAKKEKPDLLILDLMLPRMNGYLVCSLLKKDARYSHVPIILFTAKAREEDMSLGEEAGADAYVNKPYDPQVLLDKIRELIAAAPPPPES